MPTEKTTSTKKSTRKSAPKKTAAKKKAPAKARKTAVKEAKAKEKPAATKKSAAKEKKVEAPATTTAADTSSPAAQARERAKHKSQAEKDALMAKHLEEKDAVTAKLNEKIRGLIRLAKEQTYLTYKDINEALPESVNKPDEIENVISILENLEVNILDQSEVENYKQRLEQHEEEQDYCSRSRNHAGAGKVYWRAKVAWSRSTGSSRKTCTQAPPASRRRPAPSGSASDERRPAASSFSRREKACLTSGKYMK